MRSFKFKINGNEYEADVKSVKDEFLTIAVNGIDYDISLEKKDSKTPIMAIPKVMSSTLDTNLKTAKPGEAQPNTIKAPIPGTILKINCKVGDNVKLGETIILLEAMKMQNEIQASISGIITEISVKEGNSVMEGDTLVIIKNE